METYRLPNIHPDYSSVHIALFRNVINAPEIRKRLIRASTMEGPEGDRARSEVDFGFVEGRLLVSREHLLVAILTTLLICLPTSSTAPSSSSTPIVDAAAVTPTAQPSASLSISTSFPGTAIRPQTRTHHLHSEILLTLSPNNNISDSIRRHGISDASDTLVIVRIGDEASTEEGVWKEIESLVEGELVSMDELDKGSHVDWPRLDKIFKLSEINRLPLTPVEIRERKVATIINTVAVKHVT